MKKVSYGVLFGFAASMIVSPLTMANRMDKRQANQRARIQQGVRSGELTRGEATRLRNQQRRVHRMENRAEADGVVTAKEKARVEQAQDRASQRIHELKHNEHQRGEKKPAAIDGGAPAENNSAPATE